MCRRKLRKSRRCWHRPRARAESHRASLSQNAPARPSEPLPLLSASRRSDAGRLGSGASRRKENAPHAIRSRRTGVLVTLTFTDVPGKARRCKSPTRSWAPSKGRGSPTPPSRSGWVRSRRPRTYGRGCSADPPKATSKPGSVVVAQRLSPTEAIYEEEGPGRAIVASSWQAWPRDCAEGSAV